MIQSRLAALVSVLVLMTAIGLLVGALLLIGGNGNGSSLSAVDPPTAPTPDSTLKQSCIDGAAVGSGNDALAEDCALLLAAKDTLRGTKALNWSTATAMSEWNGVYLKADPQRVTRLVWTWRGMDGTLPAQLGGLSALTEIQLRSAFPAWTEALVRRLRQPLSGRHTRPGRGFWSRRGGPDD